MVRKFQFSVIVALSLFVMSTGHALTLREAIQHAWRSNPDVLQQGSEYQARQHEVKQAKSGYLPSIDITAGIGYERSDNNSTRALGYDSRSLTRKELGIGLRQMLFDGYAVRSEVERQDARLRSQRYRLDDTVENIGLKTIESYLNILSNQDLLRLSEENLKTHDKIYDQIELRSRSGVGRTSDLEQITGRRASATASVFSDQVNLQDAETAFIAVVGMLPKDLQAVEQISDRLPDTLEQAIRQAVSNHPTLKSAEQDVEAAMAQNRAAKNGFYPKLDLEIGGTWNSDQDGVKGRDNDITAMIRMRYNVFSGGRDEARMRQTAALVNEAKDVRDRTYRQVVESTRLAWTAYQVTRDQLVFQQLHIQASEKTRDAYIKQFTLGQRTLLDVLNMENELFEARRSAVNTHYANLLAQYRILVAMGVLGKQLQIADGEQGTRPAADEAFSRIAVESEVNRQIAPVRDRLNLTQKPNHGG